MAVNNVYQREIVEVPFVHLILSRILLMHSMCLMWFHGTIASCVNLILTKWLTKSSRILSMATFSDLFSTFFPQEPQLY